jgi:hypothetical protein
MFLSRVDKSLLDQLEVFIQITYPPDFSDLASNKPCVQTPNGEY